MKTINGHTAQGGFTLVELMVVVAVMGILAALAAPSFTDYARRSAVESMGKQFQSTLIYARTEALAGRKHVGVCRSTDQLQCGPVLTDDAATNQRNWGDGWIVFIDKNRDGAFVVADDEVLRRNSATKGGATLRVVSGGTRLNQLIFKSRGELDGTASVLMCDRKSENARGVFLSITGRLVSSSGSLAGHKDESGNALVCL